VSERLRCCPCCRCCKKADNPHGAHGFPPVIKRGSFVRSKAFPFSDLLLDLYGFPLPLAEKESSLRKFDGDVFGGCSFFFFFWFSHFTHLMMMFPPLFFLLLHTGYERKTVVVRLLLVLLLLLHFLIPCFSLRRLSKRLANSAALLSAFLATRAAFFAVLPFSLARLDGWMGGWVVMCLMSDVF